MQEEKPDLLVHLVAPNRMLKGTNTVQVRHTMNQWVQRRKGLGLQRRQRRRASRIPHESTILATLFGRGLIRDNLFRSLRKRIGGGIDAFSFDSSACVADARWG